MLRHTATTLMLQQGLGPKVVADRLGHSTPRMTMDVYAHVAPEVQELAAGAVAAVIAAVTNPSPSSAGPASSEERETAQSLTPQGLPMAGARGLEPLTLQCQGKDIVVSGAVECRLELADDAQSVQVAVVGQHCGQHPVRGFTATAGGRVLARRHSVRTTTGRH